MTMPPLMPWVDARLAAETARWDRDRALQVGDAVTAAVAAAALAKYGAQIGGAT